MEPLDPIFLERLTEKYHRELDFEITHINSRSINPLRIVLFRVIVSINSKISGPLRNRRVRFPDLLERSFEENGEDRRPLPRYQIFLITVQYYILNLFRNINKADHDQSKYRIEDQMAEMLVVLRQIQDQLSDMKRNEQQQTLQLHSLLGIYDNEDCSHWQELIEAHKKVIRLLEIKEAQMGINLPTFERIELEERRVRVDELQKNLQEKCSDG